MKLAPATRIVAVGIPGTLTMADTETGIMHGNEIAGTLARSFEQALEQQRSLWEQVSRFARDESYRLGSRQLEHANKALEDIHNSFGMTGMVNAHQDWLRKLVQDYTDQSIRYSEMLRDLSSHTFATALDAGRRSMMAGQEAMRHATDEAAEAVEAMHRSGHAMAEAASEGFSEMAQHGAEAYGNGHSHHA
jgi:hypothetical protein